MRFRIIKKHYYAENKTVYMAQWECTEFLGHRLWKAVENDLLSCRIMKSLWSPIEFETSEEARKAISDYKKSQILMNEDVI